MASPNLFIATPCYGAMTHAAYTSSLLETKDVLHLEGIGHTVRLLAGESLVPRARGVLTAQFMASECNRLLFIDGDIRWNPSAVLRLIAATVYEDVRVACGIYPRKEIPARFPVNFVIDEDGMLNRHDECPHLIEVRDAPTGFLMIRRDVIEEMMAAYPERKCRFRENAPPEEEKFEYDLFPTPIDVDQRYLSEDFGFSRLWQKLGGHIWGDMKIRLDHYGQYRFTGDIEAAVLPSVPTRPQDIDGWMSDEELGFLSAAAGMSASVAEIGCWKGRSTFAMLQACRGPVYAVDHWEGSAAERGPGGPHAEAGALGRERMFREFRENVGHFPNLKPYMMDSLSAAQQVPDVDMVFIDGGHAYEEVLADIRAWKPRARQLLCGHDYQMAGVARAVNEELGPPAQVVGSIWVHRVG